LLPVLAFFLIVAVEIGCGSNEREGVTLWGYPFSSVSASGGVVMLEYEKGDERITVAKASGIGVPAANSYIDDKIAVYKSLFEKQRVGYRGQYTEYVECPAKFKPTFHESSVSGGKLKYYRGYASERFTTGVCAEADIHYSVISAYLYCVKGGSIFEINYFFPRDIEKYAVGFVGKLSCD